LAHAEVEDFSFVLNMRAVAEVVVVVAPFQVVPVAKAPAAALVAVAMVAVGAKEETVAAEH
jgi:hypothetical protein